MRVVILAAGEGKRMLPLTSNRPKPLLKILGKTVLDHIFEALPSEVDSAVIVIAYLGEQIKAYCGENFHGRDIVYTQGSEKGNAWSFLSAAPQVAGKKRVMALYADEIPSRENMEKCLSHTYSWLCKETVRPKAAGIVRLREDRSIEEIVEKPNDPSSNLAAVGLMVLSGEAFAYAPVRHDNGEYYLSSMINPFFKKERVMAVVTKGGCSLTTPEDIPKVEAFLKERQRHD